MGISARVWEHFTAAREKARICWDTLGEFYRETEPGLEVTAKIRRNTFSSVDDLYHTADFFVKPQYYNLELLRSSLGPPKPSTLRQDQIAFSEAFEGVHNPAHNMLNLVFGRHCPRYCIQVGGNQVYVVNNTFSKEFTFSHDLINTLAIHSDLPHKIHVFLAEQGDDFHPYLKPTLDYVLDDKFIAPSRAR